MWVSTLLHLFGGAGDFQRGADNWMGYLFIIGCIISNHGLPDQRLIYIHTLITGCFFFIAQSSFEANSASKCNETKRKRKVERESRAVVLGVAQDEQGVERDLSENRRQRSIGGKSTLSKSLVLVRSANGYD